MATGEVKRLHQANGMQVHVVGVDNKPQWSDIFIGNPRISRKAKHGTQRLVNAPGLRPYIQEKNSLKWYWRQYKPIPGEIYFDALEQTFADAIKKTMPAHVMIEPNVKLNGHANKAWPFERWQWLVRHMEDVAFFQCGAEGARWLDGVRKVVTPNFRLACAAMSASRAFVGTEGGLHHAAAALNVPAVVLWSHFIAPASTGYSTQKNIRHASEWCGSRVPCKECAESMAAISVDEVEEALRGIL